MNRCSFRLGASLALGLAVAACSHPGAAPVTPAPLPAATSQIATGRRPHVAADVTFLSGMIGHHAQAVEMADWAPTHGASSSIRILAERIVVSQRDEIAFMQNWLREHNEPVPSATSAGMTMKMDGAEHQMLMPGMLTAGQMKQLDQARGSEFDRLFLTFMIQHHQGALVMVETLFGSYGAAQDDLIFKYASDVSADQSTEVERMQGMLDGLRQTGRSTP
jgi:uncharacterized protein (DUF305 family)